LIGLPIHTGLLTEGFIVGVAFTTTVVEPVQVAAPVAVTVYTPAIEALQFGIVTFCPVAVNPLGPVQEYPVAPVAAVAFRVIVVPVQYGPRLDAVTAQTGTQVSVPPPALSVMFTLPVQPPKLVNNMIKICPAVAGGRVKVFPEAAVKLQLTGAAVKPAHAADNELNGPQTA
jgi:hypothetical protein